MPRIAYEEWNPKPATAALVVQAVAIISEYSAQGYDLTLRQLYYQFVARDLIRNSQREYKRLGGIIAKARMAGMIDWDAIVDRTRNLRAWQTWSGPQDALEWLRDRYTLEKWSHQPAYVEVWVEKEALAGVFERVCHQLGVPFFACRGYVSLSEMWSASQRLVGRRDRGKKTVVLHFGDHDPSGIDMTRDIADRTELFGQTYGIDVRRIALNMDQVEEHDPPPNPAKMSDSRAEDYVATHGYQSWELDALDPSVLSELVRTEVEQLRDQDLWDDLEAEQEEHMETMEAIADRWEEVRDALGLS